ncbi:hypothetical protein JCM3766R1_004201 [Sporobolomyces carnicolor]
MESTTTRRSRISGHSTDRATDRGDQPSSSASASSSSWRTLLSARRLVQLEAPQTPLPSSRRERRHRPPPAESINHANLGFSLSFQRAPAPSPRPTPARRTGAVRTASPAYEAVPRDAPPAYSVADPNDRVSTGSGGRVDGDSRRTSQQQQKTKGSLVERWMRLRRRDREDEDEAEGDERGRVSAVDARIGDELRGIGL